MDHEQIPFPLEPTIWVVSYRDREPALVFRDGAREIPSALAASSSDKPAKYGLGQTARLIPCQRRLCQRPSDQVATNAK